MIVNPVYGAGGGSPSTVLPEMNGVKYFYDLTNISAGGDIEVPNALENIEPLVLHSATVTDNAIQLTGEANGSYGTFNAPEIATTHEATVYIVYKTVDIVKDPAILTVWSQGDNYIYPQIRDQSVDGTTVPGIQWSSNSTRFPSSNVRTKERYAVVALQLDSAVGNVLISAIANVNSAQAIPINKIGYAGYTMSDATGKISIMSGNIYLTSCTANVRVVAVADAYHNTNEIIRNMGYLSQHYVEAYNA